MNRESRRSSGWECQSISFVPVAREVGVARVLAAVLVRVWV
jgi:hypothetical protein